MICKYVLSVGAVVALAVSPAKAVVGPDFTQGFETDTSGWFAIGAGGAVTRVASGTGGVASQEGDFHAETILGSPQGLSVAFTRFGNFPGMWPGNRVSLSLGVYVDIDTGEIGDGWLWSTIIKDSVIDFNGPTAASSDSLDFGGVLAEKTSAGAWSLSAFSTGVGPGVEIDQTGWYTLVSDWVANVDGVSVDRVTKILDDNGQAILTVIDEQQALVFDNPDVDSDDLFDIGGAGSGTLSSVGGVPITLAIDSTRLVNTIPAPGAAAALVLTGLMGLRRRRDCPHR